MTAKGKRLVIYKKCGGHCSYCGKVLEYKAMQVDHMNPKRLRGLNHVLFEGVVIDKTDDLENLMPCCRRCNHYKRGATVESFRKSMKTLHERIQSHYINKVGIDFGIITVNPFDGIFYFEQIKTN